MTDKDYAYISRALTVAVVIILLLVVWSCFNAVPVPSHYAPMVIPGPQIFVRVPQVVAPSTAVPAFKRSAKFFRHSHTSCGAECLAYRKAYHNAAYANFLLGERRYNTGPLVVLV